jgi:hypothetical protein
MQAASSGYTIFNILSSSRKQTGINIERSKILCDIWSMLIISWSESADQYLTGAGEAMSNSSSERNKAIVLEAFETLFNKHSAHIPAGRDGLLGLIKSLPPTLRYEPGVILAERD